MDRYPTGSYGLPIKNQCWGLPCRQYVWHGDEAEQVQILDPDYTGEGAPAFAENKLNLYRPSDNLKAFGMFMGMTGRNHCSSGPFKRGLVEGDFTESYEKLIPLFGYRHDEGAVTPITSQETIYETFAKSVGLYNGKAKLARTPWPEMLKTQGIPSTKQVEDGDGNKDYLKLCFSCKYTMQVRNQRFGLVEYTLRRNRIRMQAKKDNPIQFLTPMPIKLGVLGTERRSGLEVNRLRMLGEKREVIL